MPGSRELNELEKQVERAILAIQNPLEREVLRNYRAALDEIRSLLANLYEKYAVDGALTLVEMTKYNRLEAMEKQIAEIMGPVYGQVTRTLGKLPETVYQQSFYRHEWAIDQAAGVALKWGQINDKAIRAAVANPLDKIALEGLKRNGLDSIRRTITQGLIQGQSYDKMAREVKGAFDNTARNTIWIARTEGNRAMVEGQQATYEDARDQGIEFDEVWDATLDARTRPEHARLDGKKKDQEKGGWYVPGIGWVSGPLQSGDPAFDINCRCRVRGQLKEYPPKVRRIRGEGLQPYTTFTDWAKERGLAKNVYGQEY